MDLADGWWVDERPKDTAPGEPDIKNGHFLSCYVCCRSFHQVPEEAIVRKVYEATEETKDVFGWRQITVLYKYVISWCKSCDSLTHAK
jgi:hypothetical protein